MADTICILALISWFLSFVAVDINFQQYTVPSGANKSSIHDDRIYISAMYNFVRRLLQLDVSWH